MTAEPEFLAWFVRQAGNHLWQSTAFVAVAFLIAVALRSTHARARHWVWLAASVKFLVPFGVLASLGGVIGSWIAPAAPAARVPYTLEQVVKPFALPQEAVPVVAAPASAPGSAAFPVAAVLLAVWFIGFAAVLFHWWNRWRHVRAAVRASLPLREGREADALRRLRSDVELVSSDARLEPGTFGILKPVLWLPAGIADRLSEAELDAILAHELCHARRRDNLWAAVHMAVEAIFWFHPLVWWLGARLIEERERACDEEVVRLGSEPQAYAEGVLKVCEFYLESPLPCAAGVTGADLRKRIEGIMTSRFIGELCFWKKSLLAALLAAVLACPFLLGVFKAEARTAESGVQPATAGPIILRPLNSSWGQSQPRERFEVASIKPSAPGQGMMIRQLSPGRMSFDNAPLRRLIQSAFGARSWEISGVPAWVSTAYYAINAKAPGPANSAAMWRMMRTLLEDRFNMKWHREKRVMPVYILSVAKSGKLPKPQEGSCAAVPLSTPLSQPAPGKRALPPCGGILMPVKPPRAELYGGKVQMAALVSRLTDILGRPVIDQTGFVGIFDLQLEFAFEMPGGAPPRAFPETPSESSEPQSIETSGVPSIFTALRQQLGLRIQSGKAPIEVIVIDSIERPSSN